MPGTRVPKSCPAHRREEEEVEVEEGLCHLGLLLNVVEAGAAVIPLKEVIVIIPLGVVAAALEAGDKAAIPRKNLHQLFMGDYQILFNRLKTRGLLFTEKGQFHFPAKKSKRPRMST